MREILFRGKRIDNGEWIEGYLLKVCNYATCSWDLSIEYKDPQWSGSKAYNTAAVDPSTICQFTDLTDKNGKKVFEGDILKFTDVKYEYEWIGRVEFGNPNEEYNWGFQLVYIKGEKPNTDILCWFDMEEAGAFAEVIGNIHDNPELLENP